MRYFISFTSIDATALAFDEQNYWKAGRSMSLCACDTTQSKQSLIYSANIEVFITLIKCTQTMRKERMFFSLCLSLLLVLFSPFLLTIFGFLDNAAQVCLLSSFVLYTYMHVCIVLYTHIKCVHNEPSCGCITCIHKFI